MRSPPSSSRRKFADDPELEAARGSVRDAIGSLRNLEQLARSIRVAPRSLESLVPDALASCPGLHASLRQLIGAVSRVLPDGAGTAALDGFVANRIAELSAALDGASGGSINAARRLTLERSVSRLVTELDSARALVDLLEEAAFGATLSLDPHALLRDTFRDADLSPDSGPPAIPATLAHRGSGELTLNPRATTHIVSLSTSLLVSRGGGARAHVDVVSSDGRAIITVRLGTGAGEPLLVPRGAATEPLAVCLGAAARALGARLTHDAGSVTFVAPG